MTKETIEQVVGDSIQDFLEEKNELSFKMQHPMAVVTLQQLNTLAKSWRATGIEVGVGSTASDATLSVIMTR